MKCVMQVVRHLTCENMDVPENGAQRGVKTRVTTGTEDVNVRGQIIAFFLFLGVNGFEHMEERCAESWRRLRNDHVQLHVRAYGDCPVSW